MNTHMRDMVAEWRKCRHCEQLTLLHLPENQVYTTAQTHLDHIINQVHTTHRCRQIDDNPNIEHGTNGTCNIYACKLSPNTPHHCPHCHNKSTTQNQNQWHVCWHSYTNAKITYATPGLCYPLRNQEVAFSKIGSNSPRYQRP